MRRGRALSSPGLVREYLSIAYGARESELFGMVMLDLCVAIRNVELGSIAP